MVGNSCHKPIIYHVLYCFYRAVASSVYVLPSEVRFFVTDILSVRRMSLTFVLMCSEMSSGFAMVGLLLLCRMAPKVGLGMKNVSLHFSSYSTILKAGDGLALWLFWKETFQT